VAGQRSKKIKWKWKIKSNKGGRIKSRRKRREEEGTGKWDWESEWESGENCWRDLNEKEGVMIISYEWCMHGCGMEKEKDFLIRDDRENA
jgi:hypothetical protein